jgi:hypothetical protein
MDDQLLRAYASRGNVFTDSLPSNGSIRHNTFWINICADVRDTGLSPQRLGFITGFMVYKFALGHIYLQMDLLRSPSANQSIIARAPYLCSRLASPIIYTGLPLVHVQFFKVILFWRMPSSGMWRRVDLVWTNVSEELIASIFRVKNPHARNQHEQVAADCIIHSHRRENLKPYIVSYCTDYIKSNCEMIIE